jgi:hypothetical protein
MKKYGGGKADDYLAFIKTLKPYVDKTTKPNRQKAYTYHKLSLVVLNSFYAVLKYPEIFGKQECFRLLLVLQRHLYPDGTIKRQSKIYFL